MRISDWSSDGCSSDLPVAYTTHAFGRYGGFQTGLLIYVSRVAAIAASANLIVSYAAALWAPLASGAPKIAAIIGYISIATLLNAVGVRAGMAMVYVISILKLAPLILLIFVGRSEEHTSELQSLLRISYAVFCLKNKKK